ncbi:MAG: patatin-like phospholipase family protein [Gemmatimonadetes bacterium]|nr:patatin-like phospholipase family protein [Gemmatimonadota bacterium]
MKLARNYTLVLGGGGMRGLAHVGVLAALEEKEFLPEDVVGSSVGALIAAAWCSGMPIDEMRHILADLRRSDLFQIAHRDMAMRRLRSPALYRTEPLANFINGLLGDLTFDELNRPLLVNTVDINTGTQVFWGQKGLRDVPVADAVLASCALPGFVAPHEIRGRYFVDGAAAANLPVHPGARHDRDMVLAVDVGQRRRDQSRVQNEGFAAVYARAIEIAVKRMDETALRHWDRPALVLLRPEVWHISLLSFAHNAELVEAGYRAAKEWLDDPDALPVPGATGIFPRRRFHVEVDRERCVGCGACVTLGPPGLFQHDGTGKVIITDAQPNWSPVDGFCVAQCPTGAITARPAEG